jgi:hypothetical protein
MDLSEIGVLFWCYAQGVRPTVLDVKGSKEGMLSSSYGLIGSLQDTINPMST